MTDNKFDELWQWAETERYSQRLALEYPAWQRRQKRMITVVTSLVVVVSLAISLLLLQHRQPQDYEKVYCNHVGITDEQWVQLAAEMLLE